MEQTKITKDNRKSFLQQMYAVSTYPENRLISLNTFLDKKILAIDSCGWHYEQIFKNANITKLEHIETAKNFNLSKTQFDILYNKIENIKEAADVLLLDHCPAIFKYQTVAEIKNILNTITKNTNATHCLVRMNTITLNDNRFADRFFNLSSMLPQNFVVNTFTYTEHELSFKITKKKEYAFGIN